MWRQHTHIHFTRRAASRLLPDCRLFIAREATPFLHHSRIASLPDRQFAKLLDHKPALHMISLLFAAGEGQDVGTSYPSTPGPSHGTPRLPNTTHDVVPIALALPTTDDRLAGLNPDFRYLVRHQLVSARRLV